MKRFKGTQGPYEVHKYNHANNELWLGIGKAIDHSGPICDIRAAANLHNPKYDIELAKRHNLKCVAELKYLITDETEQRANAQLLATSFEILESLITAQKYIEALEEKLMQLKHNPANIQIDMKHNQAPLDQIQLAIKKALNYKSNF